MKYVRRYNERFEEISGMSSDELFAKFNENPTIKKLKRYLNQDEEDVETIKKSIAWIIAGDYGLIARNNDIYSTGVGSCLVMSVISENIPSSIKIRAYEAGIWTIFRFICIPVSKFVDSYISIRVNKSILDKFLYLPITPDTKNKLGTKISDTGSDDTFNLATKISDVVNRKKEPGKQFDLFNKPTQDELLYGFKPINDLILRRYSLFYSLNEFQINVVSNMLAKEFNLYKKDGTNGETVYLSITPGGISVIVVTSEISPKKEELTENEHFYIFKTYVSNIRNICMVIKVKKTYIHTFLDKEISDKPWDETTSNRTTYTQPKPKEPVSFDKMKELLAKSKNKRGIL